MNLKSFAFLQEVLVSSGALVLDRGGEVSGDLLLFSAVRTAERAATAAFLCVPWTGVGGFGLELLDPELNAEDKAAKASALWVGPPWFEPLDLSLGWNNTEETI